MAEVKWIKLSIGIFDDDKMCILESYDNGLVFEIIWIKILCLAGKCNQDGYLMVSNGVPYTDNTISKMFRLDKSLVEDAMKHFVELGMIEKHKNVYMVSNWLLHQNASGLETMREKNRERQKRYRENQKNKVSNVTDNVTDNVTESISESKSYIYKEIIDYLNEKTGCHYQYTTGKTQRCINARLKEGFVIDDFIKAIDTKCDEWLNKKDMAQYLRPETLFGTKFESYLNQKGVTSGHTKANAGRTTKDALDYWNV